MQKLFALLLLTLISAAFSSENMLVNPTLAEKDAKGNILGWNKACSVMPNITPLPDGVVISSGNNEHATLTQRLDKVIEVALPYIVTAQIRADEPTQAQFYVEAITLDAKKQRKWQSFSSARRDVGQNWLDVSFKVSVQQKPISIYIVIRSCQGKPVTFRNLSVSLAPIKKTANGYWSLENGVEVQDDGVVVTEATPAKLLNVAVEPGKTYSLTYDCVGIGETGNDYVFHPIIVKANPYGIKGGYFFNDVKNTPMPKAQKLAIPANAAYRNIELVFSTTSKGKVRFYNLAFKEYIPDPKDSWRLFLDTPFYRDMIFSSHDAGVIEGHVLATEPAANATVSVPGVGLDTCKFANGIATFSIPAKGLKDGRYSLACTIQDNEGKPLKVFSRTIVKVPKAPVEVIGTPSRYYLFNGKPFFPVTQWSMFYKDDEASLYQSARNGFNSTFIHIGSDIAKTRETLDRFQKFGMKVIISLGACNTLSPSQLQNYRDSLEQKLPPDLRQHPAIIAYFMIDEPLWAGKPAAPLAATLEILKDFDPYHPVWINAAPRNEVEDLIPYGEACDIFGVDIYPIPYPNNHSGLDDKGITSVGKYARRMLDTTFWRKPNWMALQGFAWASLNNTAPEESYIYPTKTQMRFMAFDAMLNGCTGYGLWGTQYIRNFDFYETIFHVTRELHQMSGLYVGGKQLPDLQTPVKDVRVVPLACNGASYFAVMNLLEKETAVAFDTGLGKQTFTVYADNSSIRSEDGKVSLALPPYGVAFFGNAPLPAPAYSLPEVNPDFEAKGNAIAACMREFQERRATVKPYKGNANWIWNDTNDNSAAAQTLIAKNFTLDAIGKNPTLYVAADDSSEVYVNGKLLGKTQDWDLLFHFDLTGTLKPGQNTIMIRGADAGALPCGILAELHMDGKVILITDASWLAAPISAKAPCNPLDTNGFKPAKIIAPYGKGAWGFGVNIKK